MAVPDLIGDARGYTNGLVNSAQTAMTAAINSAQAVGYSVPNYQAASLPSAPPSSITADVPVIDTITLDLPNEPSGSVVFQDIGSFDPGTAPTFSGSAPTIVMPNTPTGVADFAQSAPNVNTSLVFPEPPAALLNPLVEAPVLTDHDAPVKPNTVVPVFSAVAPADLPAAPDDHQATFENAYASAAPSTIAMMEGYVDSMLTKRNPRFNEQMEAIEQQLKKYMQGGTGLSASVETAIYQRSAGKNDAEARRVRDQAIGDMAKRGFTLPSGALASAIQQARQAGADNNARSATEIAINQAELEQKNLQFAMTMSTGLRTTLLNMTLTYHQNLIGFNGQALEYAKTVLTAVIEVYNTAVKGFTAKLEAYKAEAVVFETKLKSAMAGIELYRIEIQALESMVNVDKAKVEIYRARIESLTSLSNVYRAQIEAVQGRVSMEKLKLEVFQAQVQTYATQVQAKSAEWQGYTAAIEGQTAKARIFATQVEAFGAQVGAYKAVVEAKAEGVRAIAASNQAKATQYNALMSGYQTVVQARGEKARTQIQAQSQRILAYQAKVSADVANAQVQQGYYKAMSDVAIQNAGNNLKAQLGEIESRRAFGQTLAQLGTANAQIYGNLAGSAMAGMNTLAAETLAS